MSIELPPGDGWQRATIAIVQPGHWFLRAVFGSVGFFILAGLPWLSYAFLLQPHRHDGWFWATILFAVSAACLAPHALSAIGSLDEVEHDEVQWWSSVIYAIVVLVVAVSGVLVTFASVYLVFFGHSTARFSAALDRPAAVYFTLGQFTTAGSGISAKSHGAEMVASAQFLIDTILVVGVIAFVIGNIKPRLMKPVAMLDHVEPVDEPPLPGAAP